MHCQVHLTRRNIHGNIRGGVREDLRQRDVRAVCETVHVQCSEVEEQADPGHGDWARVRARRRTAVLFRYASVRVRPPEMHETEQGRQGRRRGSRGGDPDRLLTVDNEGIDIRVRFV